MKTNKTSTLTVELDLLELLIIHEQELMHYLTHLFGSKALAGAILNDLWQYLVQTTCFSDAKTALSELFWMSYRLGLYRSLMCHKTSA